MCVCVCKILVNAQKCNYGETVPKKSHLNVPDGLKSQQTLTLFYCLFKGSDFSSADLEMGVCVCLKEVSIHGR